MGALVSKWTSINVPLVVSKYTNGDGKEIITTVQMILDQLMPGLLPLLLTFLCMRLLKKKVNAIALIFALFAVGIIGYALGVLA
ncbi:Mannose permease IID component [compost metagenome]